MEEKDKFLGCFVSVTHPYPNASQQAKDLAVEQGAIFRSYIWGKEGIENILKKLKNETYGKDLMIILFQFLVNPLPIELQYLKEIEPYRKKEKAIGIPIIVTDENFFSKSEEGRYNFLKQSIMQKIDLLAEVVKKKKLDTKMDLLKTDLEKLLSIK